MLAGRGPITAGFERKQLVQLILTKVVFAYEKPLVVTLWWAPTSMTKNHDRKWAFCPGGAGDAAA